MVMKRINLKTLFIIFILVISLALGALPGCITITTPETPETPPTTTPSAPTTPINPGWTPPPSSNQTAELPSIADVVALVKPSVVAITTEVVSYDFFNRPFTQEGAGSGWVLDEDGIIVTNNHVVAGASIITVTMDDGRTFTADMQSVSTDPLNDLAILKIDARNLPALERGDTSGLRVGDWVIAIGNALGQGIRATEGIVSRKGVSLSVSQGQTLYDLLETSAAINPGNSGGPLVNLAGEVIGITSAKVAQIGIEGMGYAISIDIATPIVQELINKGYVVRPWLGVSLYTVDQIAIRQLNLALDKGVLLVEVVGGSPAVQAGLKAGDVISSIGGEEVANVQELTRVLHKSKIGQPLEIIFWRGNAKSTVQVTPEESPPP
jgi:serine protease Do